MSFTDKCYAIGNKLIFFFAKRLLCNAMTFACYAKR